MNDFCVITVAYSTYPFSKIFINSFKKYYPNVKLYIVNNNKKNNNYFFTEEAKFLHDYSNLNENVEIFDNNTNDTSHGNGLDLIIEKIKNNINMLLYLILILFFLK